MSELKVIIINGQGEVGKDTFVDFCKKKRKNVYSYSTVDSIKNFAINFGWTGEKGPKDRKMLSELKRILKEWNDVPYRKMADLIYDIKKYTVEHDENEYIFIHSREPEEINRFKKEFNAVTVLVRREEVEKKWNNKSDDEVFDYFYDYVIINNNLSELEQAAEYFMDNLDL